jgi:hypothetical protein
VPATAVSRSGDRSASTESMLSELMVPVCRAVLFSFSVVSPPFPSFPLAAFSPFSLRAR